MAERIEKNPIEEELAMWAEEREVQIDLLCRYGFHKELGFSAQEYADTIPVFSAQPEEYKNRFDGQLIVEGRIPLHRQHQLANIEEWIDADRVKNVTPVPPEPYVIWTHDGNLHRGKHAKQAQNEIGKDEVPSPLIEVTAVYLQYRDVFRDHGIDAPGSRSDLDSIPSLHTFHHGVPRVNRYWTHEKPERWGVLTRGSNIKQL